MAHSVAIIRTTKAITCSLPARRRGLEGRGPCRCNGEENRNSRGEVVDLPLSWFSYEFPVEVILLVILPRTIFNIKLDMSCHIFMTGTIRDTWRKQRPRFSKPCILELKTADEVSREPSNGLREHKIRNLRRNKRVTQSCDRNFLGMKLFKTDATLS